MRRRPSQNPERIGARTAHHGHSTDRYGTCSSTHRKLGHERDAGCSGDSGHGGMLTGSAASVAAHPVAAICAGTTSPARRRGDSAQLIPGCVGLRARAAAMLAALPRRARRAAVVDALRAALAATSRPHGAASRTQGSTPGPRRPVGL